MRDGGYSAQEDCTHQYASNGSYTVKLRVMNTYGCKDSTTQNITIINVSARALQGLEFSFIAYPNPFYLESTVRFTLPADANVNLEMFDMTGRSLHEPGNSKMPAGIHEITLNSESLQSITGVFFVKLTVNGQASVIRLFQLK